MHYILNMCMKIFKENTSHSTIWKNVVLLRNKRKATFNKK